MTAQMKTDSEARYVPGVCNIGPAERAKRRMGGIIGTALMLVLFGILVAIHAPVAWRLLLFFPAFIGATGFLQDAFHFCAGFGLKGLYNVARSAGVTDNVISEEFRKKDKAKAFTIFALSLIIAVALAIVSIWL